MARATLTAANSVIFLTIPDLFPVPQQLQGYAADDVLTTEAVDSAEVVMGIDGKISAGWVPTLKRQTFTLQANSQSAIMFDAWQQAQEAARDLYTAIGTINLPAIGWTYVCQNGYLSNYMPVPDVRRILQPRRFTITWESILGAPI